jgi:penicillin-binding protein 1A
VAALPIWIAYMGQVLKDVPQEAPVAPEGVVAARINPDTGLRDPTGSGGLLEYFYHENLPPEGEAMPAVELVPGERRPEDVKSDLY